MGILAIHFGKLIGAAGIDRHENELARRVGLLFDVPMLMAALWVLMNWWGKSHGTVDGLKSHYYDVLLWGFFVLESALLTALVTHKRRYLRENWLNLVIIVLGIPLLMGVGTHLGMLRLLRLLIVLALLAHVGSRIRNLLSRNQLGTTLLASLMVILMAGLMMAALDPNIRSVEDGIWWAWVTVTTVGYGDVVPTSTAGRVFGGLIILFGIGLFAMITASLAAFFVSRQEEEMLDEERETLLRLAQLDDRLIRLEEKLDRLMDTRDRDRG
ncbi:MAG TPA: ion transporter [Porticoccaceae bacterium]|nr:ion transporter [Porticoccaceae bacterium]